jgi:hypothetical protein
MLNMAPQKEVYGCSIWGSVRPSKWTVSARSPDITHLDCFLWGYVKNKAYVTKVTEVEDLKTRIWDVITITNTDMLGRTCTEFEFGLD